jgi:hypothetical protein
MSLSQPKKHLSVSKRLSSKSLVHNTGILSDIRRSKVAEADTMETHFPGDGVEMPTYLVVTDIERR